VVRTNNAIFGFEVALASFQHLAPVFGHALLLTRIVIGTKSRDIGITVSRETEQSVEVRRAYERFGCEIDLPDRHPASIERKLESACELEIMVILCVAVGDVL
jgi:hypothetical protein